MKVFVLGRLDETDHEQFDAFVIVAQNEQEARAIAFTEDRSPNRWLDGTKTSCIELDLNYERHGVILSSYIR